ncbi:RidA family protein [Microvirga aerilata]|uniref:RidA family protein n=1 Tax=Microvirga aerilata TaxID=670292 RepID=A0A937CZ76_9HYPH|nr:RidA family protein [Microvirga aerilata]MBL0404371.1 RidA family protein [Microvirga aerilata]
MTKRAIIPPEFRTTAEQLKMSPAVVSGDHVFLTGVTGSDARGQMPDDAEAQIRTAFEKIGCVLRAGGLTFHSIVEMTTYHMGLRDHFDLFNSIRLEYLNEPYPAWTAVEVAGLRREGAIVEIRVIAYSEPRD